MVNDTAAPLLASLDNERIALQSEDALDEKAERARFEALHQLERSYGDLNSAMDNIEVKQAWGALDELRSAAEFGRLAVVKAEAIRTGKAADIGEQEESTPSSLPEGSVTPSPLETMPSIEDDEGEDDELLSQMVAAQAKKNRKPWHSRRGGGSRGGGSSKGKGKGKH